MVLCSKIESKSSLASNSSLTWSTLEPYSQIASWSTQIRARLSNQAQLDSVGALLLNRDKTQPNPRPTPKSYAKLCFTQIRGLLIKRVQLEPIEALLPNRIQLNLARALFSNRVHLDLNWSPSPKLILLEPKAQIESTSIKLEPYSRIKFNSMQIGAILPNWSLFSPDWSLNLELSPSRPELEPYT